MIKALPHHVVGMGVTALPAAASEPHVPKRNWCATSIIALVASLSALSLGYIALVLSKTAPMPHWPIATSALFWAAIIGHDGTWLAFSSALLGLACDRHQASFAVLLLTPAHIVSCFYLFYWEIRARSFLSILPVLDVSYWLLLSYAARNPALPASSLWLPMY